MKTEDFYSDDTGKQVPPERATKVERVETDADGRIVSRRFFVLKDAPGEPPSV